MVRVAPETTHAIGGSSTLTADGIDEDRACMLLCLSLPGFLEFEALA